MSAIYSDIFTAQDMKLYAAYIRMHQIKRQDLITEEMRAARRKYYRKDTIKPKHKACVNE